jgi:transporter family-2 protein
MIVKFLLPALLTLAAGACVVTQQVLNTSLRTALNSVAWSGLVSYLVGVLCMGALAIALRDPVPALGVVQRVPWWAWTGGLFGAIFIGSAIVLLPQLGAATFIALLVTGQMLASLAFDHWGAFGLDVRPVDPMRVLGVALLIGGVVLVRR